MRRRGNHGNRVHLDTREERTKYDDTISAASRCGLADSPHNTRKRSHTERYKTLSDSELCHLVPHPLRVHVGIDLGRGDELVPQRLLDEPDVPGPVVEPGREGVPQRVGRDPLGDACLSHPTCDYSLD